MKCTAKWRDKVSVGAGAVLEEPVVVVRPPPKRGEETDEQLRQRLLYQSRKRGIRENDLLMGTFAGEELGSMNRAELEEYDGILNEHDNEWDMYKWMVGKMPLPEHLKDSSVMKKLVVHAENKEMEMRIDVPQLHRKG